MRHAFNETAKPSLIAGAYRLNKRGYTPWEESVTSRRRSQPSGGFFVPALLPLRLVQQTRAESPRTGAQLNRHRGALRGDSGLAASVAACKCADSRMAVSAPRGLGNETAPAAGATLEPFRVVESPPG